MAEYGFPAKFPGVCPRCDQAYAAGTHVVRDRGHLIHVECARGWVDE